jgi:hypothetical protein
MPPETGPKSTFDHAGTAVLVCAAVALWTVAILRARRHEVPPTAPKRSTRMAPVDRKPPTDDGHDPQRVRMRRMLRDLTFADFSLGGGPLLFAVVGGVNAARADQRSDRWMWTAAVAVMLGLGIIYVVWSLRRNRSGSCPH